jgi:hypothetical protein
MPKHRNPRQRLSKQPPPSNSAKPEPTFDFDGTLDVLRDNVARADAMLVTADELIVQLWSGSGTGDSLSCTRRKNHVSYLMESARIAVRAAMHAGDELDLHRGRE